MKRVILVLVLAVGIAATAGFADRIGLELST